MLITCSLFKELTFKTDITTFTGGTSASVTAGRAVLDRTALFKTKPLGSKTRKIEVNFSTMLKTLGKAESKFQLSRFEEFYTIVANDVMNHACFTCT